MSSLLKIRQWISDRYGRLSLHLMDYTMLAYLLILGLLVIPFHNNVQNWGIYPIIHVVIAWVIVEFIRIASLKPNPIINFIRIFYPALGLALMWGELNTLVTMIFPYWANDFLVNLDKTIFGVHPTVWVETLFTPWLTELMNFFYISYFIFIPLGGLTLYFKGKHQETLDFLFLVLFTYNITFLLFLLFPAEGPWIILKEKHTIEPTGGYILRLVQFVEGRGSIKGGCFPSSHVAAAFTITLATFRSQKMIGFILLPLAIGIAVSTVYCRYHHAVDSIAGIILGVSLYVLGSVLLKTWYTKQSIK